MVPPSSTSSGITLSAVDSRGVLKRVTDTTTPSVAGSASRDASVCRDATQAAAATTGSTSCVFVWFHRTRRDR